MEQVGLGTELKINVHIEPIGKLHMSDYNFFAKFFTKETRVVSISKEDMIKEDDDNYLALLDTRNLTAGALKVIIEAEIPDADFKGYRTEVTPLITTDIIISK